MRLGRRDAGLVDPSDLGAEESSPELHYLRGNRLFDQKTWREAAAEWRKADVIWHPVQGSGFRRIPWLKFRAVLLLLLTVLAIHQSLYYIFPRDPSEMMMLANESSNRSWWERFLDAGRPQPGDDHKMTIREWWESMRRKLGDHGQDQVVRSETLRPTVPERWADLIRRYGRLGDSFVWDLDYSIISGHGLSRMGDYDAAIEVLEKSAKEADTPAKAADAYQGLANAHYYKGYRLQPGGLAEYDLNQVSKAARSYEESIKRQPRPLSYGNLGWMYYLLGDYERAQERSQQALRLNRNLHYVRLNLGLIYLVQGKLRDSFDSYYTVIRARPDEEVYLGGINDLREVMRDNPGRHPFANFLIGLLALKKGDLSQAKEALERFLGSPSVGRNWEVLGRELLEEMDTKGLEK